MSTILRSVLFSGGLNTKSDPSALEDGELVEATGVFYERGDSLRLQKLHGRFMLADTGTAKKVDGVRLAVFDDAEDRVIALSDGELFTGIYGMGLNSEGEIKGDRVVTAHYANRHYIATGEASRVMDPDGTVRTPSLSAPRTRMALTAGTAASGSTEFSQDLGGAFSDAANAIDSNDQTFAYSALSTPQVTQHIWACNVDVPVSNHYIYIRWAIAGPGFITDDRFGGATGEETAGFGDGGGDIRSDFDVVVKFEVSELSSPGWVTLIDSRFRAFTGVQVLQYKILNSTNLNQNRVRASFQFVGGTSQAVLRVYRIRASNGSSVTNFTTSSALLYAFAEYDADHGIVSPLGEGGSVSLATQNQVSCALPAAVNAGTTNFIIYRTPEGGSKSQLGRIAMVPVSQTTFIDDFVDWASTEQPYPLAQNLILSVDGASLPFDKTTPMPALKYVAPYQGGLVGITSTGDLRYSLSGFPEYWPDIYVIPPSGLSEDDDTLVAMDSVGSSLIVTSKGGIFRVDGLPRAVGGSFQPGSGLVPIEGAPGCVGPRAIARYAVSGVPAFAWISPYGIYSTDGFRFEPLSEDFDWDAIDDVDMGGWVLTWNQKRMVLEFDYSTQGGQNDRYYLLHMGDKKANGQPKWTGPHYGKRADVHRAQIGNQFVVVSANTTDGKIYKEWDEQVTDDASAAYNGSRAIPVSLGSGQIRSAWDYFTAYKAILRHTDFGDGETATVRWETGRDEVGEDPTQIREQLVSLAGQRGTQFDISRAGEWHRWHLTYEGTGRGKILDFRVEVDRHGRAGVEDVA